jgi:uncharacterized protein
MIQLIEEKDDVLLPVKVVPKSSRDKITGELDGSLKVNISAAPEKGAANKALCKFLAKQLGVKAKQVSVDTGQSSPRKTLRINGLKAEQIRQKLSI